jgi:uncharacterized membrane protein
MPQQYESHVEWWRRHPSLATACVALLVLAVTGFVLLLHLSQDSTSAESSHERAGDLTYFGVVSALVLFAATVVITHRHRR